MVDLRIYYDFASPFCYVALEIVRRLQSNADLRVHWLPFEVIDYLPERGAMPQNPAFVRRNEAAQAAKLAREYGLEIHLRERLLNSNLALCAVEHARHCARIAAVEADAAGRLLRDLFDAFYRHQRDISDLPVVLDVARSSGLDGGLEAALRSGTYKAQVAASKRDAVEQGVVAVPTWLVGGMGVVGVPALAEIERLVRTAIRGTLSTSGSS